MARESAAILCLTCLLAFVLLVVTCCSAPASSAINHFKVILGLSGQEAQLEVGILGFCLRSRAGLDGTGCSPRSLGFRLLIGSPGAGGSSGLGWGGGFPSSGAINGARLGTVVASEDLTRAMVFTPLATAASGLTTIFAMAAWASRGNRNMELVAIVMSAVTAILSWIAFAINMAISARVKQGVDALQSSIPSNQNLAFIFGAATFLPLGTALVLSAALVWAVYEYMQGKPDIGRRDSAETTLEYDRARSEKQLR